MSISPVVKKETIRIATGCIALSAVMVAVFALCFKKMIGLKKGQ